LGQSHAHKKSPGVKKRAGALKKQTLFSGFLHQGFDDLAGTQAACAHAHSAHFAGRKLVAHALQIGLKGALGLDIRVADHVAYPGILAAKLADLAACFLMSGLGHGKPPYIGRSFWPARKKSSVCPFRRSRHGEKLYTRP